MSMSTALSLLLYHAPICVTFFSVLFSFHALNLCIFPQFMFSHSVLYDLSLIWSLSFLDLCLSSLTLFVSALLEKQSKFPRYNMKCRGKRDTTWNIPRNITFSPLHFMLYRGQLITFGSVDKIFKVSWKNLKVIKVEQNIKNKFESGAKLGLYREICGLHNIARLSL